MRVHISQNRYGHITFYPVSVRIQNKVSNYLKRQGVESTDCDIYIQFEYDVEEFLNSLPGNKGSEVRAGYSVNINMSDDEYLALLGHNALNNLKL